MENNNIKYLIAGTGGVGGSIAAFLSLAGKDVTCIARGEHLAAIREHGLCLHSDLKGKHILPKNIQVKPTSSLYVSKAIP
jgi:2-dehydropantoate 2-reductase